MDQLKHNLVYYLSEVTGQKIIATLLNSGDLPYFLSRQYGIYKLEVGNATIMAVFLKQTDAFKPGQFIKHMRQIPAVDVENLCVVAQSLPTYVRKRLIEKGVAFVVPKVQMYLPALGMDLRPRSVVKNSLVVERFSPATQVVLIDWLLGRAKGAQTPLALSKQLGYSSMTMSRTLDELETSQIAQVSRVGRERFVSFSEDRKTIWLEIRLRLRNPVTQTVRILKRDIISRDAQLAGITALAARSMLSEPTYPEYAISRDAWKAMEKAGIETIPMEDSDTCLLQVWCYDPKTLAVDGYVDPFSLYLSLQNETDERIEMALEDMMEQYL